VAIQTAATNAARIAQQEAIAAVAAAQRQQRQLEATLASNRAKLRHAHCTSRP